MLPGKVSGEIDEMKNTEEKQLLQILKENGEPFIKKCDGYAVKMDEDKQIEYKDWEDNERTLKVPAGSYVVVDSDCRCPRIITSEDWEKKNKFVGEKESSSKKESKKSNTGLESMVD